MKIKVLNLEDWMLNDVEPGWGNNELGNEPFPEIDPTFNRDGWYLHGDKCWAEIGGKAYRIPVRPFAYQLSLLHAQEYNHRHYEALQHIMSVGLASNKQKELFYMMQDVKSLRETIVNMGKYHIRGSKDSYE